MNEGLSLLETPEKILEKTFDHHSFRPLQKEIINHLLYKGDAMVLMPTGGGKSLCYQIPALCTEGLTLVVSPLISLMINQVEALKEKGVAAAYLNSNLNLDEKRALANKIQNREISILYTSPEALAGEKLINFLNRVGVTLLAIDEAHCVSQWGHEFRKDYRNLGEVRRALGKPRCIALTATADALVSKDIHEELDIHPNHLFCSGFDRPNLTYKIKKRDGDGTAQLKEFLSDKTEQTGIIYCSTRKKTEEIATFLQAEGFKSHAYHAGMSDEQRAHVQGKFENEENVIIVATIAFGMGIDRPDVRFVVHVNLSKNVECFYQETGRAGRDGLPSQTLMLYGAQEFELYRRFIRESDADEQYQNIATKKLFSMQKLADSMQCRRRFIRRYFGEKVNQDCGNCDNCLSPAPGTDWSFEAKNFLKAVKETGQRFGKVHLIDILRGSKKERIKQFGHQKLSIHGKGKLLNVEQWKDLSDSLIAEEFLIRCEKTDGLKIARRGHDLLKGNEHFYRRTTLQNLKKKATKSKRQEKERTPDDALYDWLKLKRNEAASELEFPPFMITSNKTLEEISSFKPTTKNELLNIKGIGQTKLEEYGDLLLGAVKAFQKDPSTCQEIVKQSS